MAKKKAKAAKKARSGSPKPRQAAAPAAAPSTPAASTAVLDELLKATGETTKKGEKLPQFVERVCTAVSGLPDDKFNALSPEARKWYDENLAAFNDESKPEEERYKALYALPGMPGYVAPAAEEAAPQAAAPAQPAKEDKQPETPKSEEKDDDMAKKAGAKKSAKKTTNGGGERALRTDSTSYQVRLAVVKKPDIEFDKMCANLGIKGKDAAPTGHVHNMFQHAKIVMKIAAAEGKLK